MALAGSSFCNFATNLATHVLSCRSQNLIHVLLVNHGTAFRALGFGAELATEVVNINLAVSELLHGLESVPVIQCQYRFRFLLHSQSHTRSCCSSWAYPCPVRPVRCPWQDRPV